MTLTLAEQRDADLKLAALAENGALLCSDRDVRAALQQLGDRLEQRLSELDGDGRR